ncbi:MAG TPA: trigger factor [Gemmatimonadales bacterium]|nr:trigger factor [Gemmatimonadales bacterium]
MVDIEIKKTATEPGSASIAVTVPVERVREAETQATTAYQQRVRLPGFRKGKAPAAIVKKQFADDIRQQVLQEVIRDSWSAALKQESLKPIADPHIHNLKWDQGAPLTFEFHVEVRPDLTLERTGGFRIARTVAPITEEQVSAQLEELREQRAPWTPVTDESPKPKDLVSVTIAQGTGDAATDPQAHQIVIGEGQAIPEVEERIMGLKPGATVDATVHFPADFPDETKRGQSRDVRITLHEVKRQQLASLDDAFAREVGDFESLDALRRAVREDLERDAQREADARVRSELIEQIVSANHVTAPRPLVDRALRVLAQAYGITAEQFEKFATDFRPIAEAQVRRDLVLDFITEKEQLRVTEAEVDARIAELAKRRNVSAAEARAALEKNKRLRELEHGMTEEKVFQHLLAQSTVEEATPPPG